LFIKITLFIGFNEQKVQKDPKILTNAYKDLLKEYDVDYKDSDIKKAVEYHCLYNLHHILSINLYTHLLKS
jgi:hypothetical protein